VDSTGKAPAWLIRLCKWLWAKQEFIWGAVILNIALAIFAAWLFTPFSTDFKQLPIGLPLQNPLVTCFVFIIVLLLTATIWALSRIPMAPSDRELSRRYLQRMLADKEKLALTGIPTGLIAQSVALDEVFIPLQLRPHQTKIDLPLTEQQRLLLREELHRGELPPDIERVLMAAEQDWDRLLRKSDKISMSDLWMRLTQDRPAAVIQGFPGMGKSTLMSRLALHMARHSLGQPDPTLPGNFEPPCIPVFLSLGKYAGYRSENAAERSVDCSLAGYLHAALAQLKLDAVASFIDGCLRDGRCLVLLDGLDEVSDLGQRAQVQEAIRTFILDNRSPATSTVRFNRFLITSRVAGYDQHAFPDYHHYTIAELTIEQIDDFLPRWCRANARRDRAFSSSSPAAFEEVVAREADEMQRKLSEAIKNNQGVRELAENPLLLTLLAVMQQNSIELPRQRIELYSVVTRTLLENRNLARGLPAIPEALAIQSLGPIAFQMQTAKNSFMREKEVLAALQQAIQEGTPGEKEQEALEFLRRVRERGGLFVLRTGDYFGFFHRTFQEYFAARHMLNAIKDDPVGEITSLVNRARDSGDLWREPFLLAVAYQSGEDETVARRIIEMLLDTAPQSDAASRAHDILLSAACLLEAKPATIGPELERRIATALLQLYEEAQRERKFNICDDIEDIMRRWLQGLSDEAYRPPAVMVLREAIADTQHTARQRAALTLLIVIAQLLAACPEVIFKKLVPPLLSLAGMPASGEYRPAPGLAISSSLDIVDLALAALSFIGRRGPARQLLRQVHQHFEEHPDHLHLLARYSLESGTLLTPAVVPLEFGYNWRYEPAVRRWIELRDKRTNTRVTARDLADCLDIHQALLASAEEAAYPAAAYLLRLLERSAAHPDQPWQQVWQAYLAEQMTSGSSIAYYQSILLWAMPFPAQRDLETLAARLLADLQHERNPAQRFAQRFLVMLAFDLRDLRDQRYLRDPDDLSYWRDLRNPGDLSYLRDLRNLSDLSDLSYRRNLSYLSYLSDLEDLFFLRTASYMRNLGYMRNLSYTRNLSGLSYLLLTRKMSEQVMTDLAAGNLVDSSQFVDLLTILLGRVLQMKRAQEQGEIIERELGQLVQVACDSFASAGNEEVREAALDILRYLPMRSEHEITSVLQLAERVDDERVEQACALAVEYAEPETPQARAALEAGGWSAIKPVRNAVDAYQPTWQKSGGRNAKP